MPVEGRKRQIRPDVWGSPFPRVPACLQTLVNRQTANAGSPCASSTPPSTPFRFRSPLLSFSLPTAIRFFTVAVAGPKAGPSPTPSSPSPWSAASAYCAGVNCRFPSPIPCIGFSSTASTPVALIRSSSGRTPGLRASPAPNSCSRGCATTFPRSSRSKASTSVGSKRLKR